MEKKILNFPTTFWSANIIELFERAAYYAVASFVVIYLNETLGMSPTFATFLNGTLLWGIVYFFPILSGTLADRFGFKKSLIFAFILISLGYFIMGNVQKFWPLIVGGGNNINYTFPIIVGIVFIGIGGSFVKPCISGTVQKTAGVLATLGFGIFYMTINIGSMLGRTVSYFVRIKNGIPAIFTYVATVFAVIGFFVVVFLYKEPKYQEKTEDNKKVNKPKTLKEALVGMFIVLKNYKFVFFLIVIGFFWFIYVQIYNLIPLFLRYIDPKAPVELYTIINPIMIVLFQLLITKFSKRWKPVKSIIFGVTVTVIGMLLNVLPFLLNLSPSHKSSLFGIIIPIGGIFMLLSIGSMAVGEMLASPRIYEYIGAIAPKGQEGLYLGYANLPMAIGTIIGAPIGGYLFEVFIKTPAKAGQHPKAPLMWVIVSAMGVLSILGLFLYDKYLIKEK